MLGFKAQKKRFSLYYLEEGEIYAQDMSAYCQFYDEKQNREIKEKGKIHICSTSLIFESEKPDTPLYKYFFKYFISKPELNGNNINISIKRITEIITNEPPCPYIQKDQKQQYNLEIQPLNHENPKQCYEWINNIYQYSKSNAISSDPEKEIRQIVQPKYEKKFDMSHISSINEKPIVDAPPLLTRRILPLISISGFLYPTNRTIYFEAQQTSSIDPILKFDIDQITQLYKRRFELLNIGLEIFIQEANSQKPKSLYFAFENEAQRDHLYKALRDRVKSDVLNQLCLDRSLEQWQKKEITNYEYLMRLNQAGNRSFSDLSQYPIFPWIIQDQTSESIDLNDKSIYRDLKKPIGALNQKRLNDFMERYEDMPFPKFIYGTHYSTPGYVIGYLIRKYPQYMLKLQSGKFDKPDRLFKSIKGDWMNVFNNNASVKELIPEFYEEDESFLVNQMNLKLGTRQNGKKVDDVKVPKWALNTRDFLRINREALESEYVSSNLHHWIDLIFGYKQRGPSSVEAYNVFHPYSYEGAIDLDKISDPMEKQAKRCHINEFGQCPKQLFRIPHPSRTMMNQGKMADIGAKTQVIQGVNGEEFKQEENQINNSQSNNNYSSSNNNNNNNKYNKNNNKTQNHLWDFQNTSQSFICKVHKQNINHIISIDNDPNKIISISHDGYLKEIDLEQKAVKKSFRLCQYILSCICPIKQDEIFAIGCWDSKIYIFNLVYGNTVEVISEHTDTVSAIIHLKKRSQIFTGSWDCTIKRFSVSSNGGVEDDSQDFIDHTNSITALATNGSEDIIAFGDVEGNVCVYNIDSEDMIFQFEIEEQKIIKIVINENHLIAMGDQTIKIYEISGSEISYFELEQCNGQFTDIQIDGKYIIAVTSKGHMPVYDLLQERRVGYYFKEYSQNEDDCVEEDKQFTSLYCNNESTLALVGSQNGTINILQKNKKLEFKNNLEDQEYA